MVESFGGGMAVRVSEREAIGSDERRVMTIRVSTLHSAEFDIYIRRVFE
jgi:hypothetical protein